MKIINKTSDRLIVQSSFAETSGILLISITLLTLGLVIFYFPELSHNSEEKKEVSMSLAAMGAAGLIGWTTTGFTTLTFDKNDGYLTVVTSHLFVLKKSWKYSLTEINEVRVASTTDDGITSFTIEILTKENKKVSTGFSSYSGEAVRDLASQISKFLNISVGNSPV
jgi:hypothetical protein